MKLNLPDGTFGAFLFDCDGTIVDSMPLHYAAWSKALAEWKCELSQVCFYAWGGMPIVEIIKKSNEEQGLEMPVKELSRRKEEYYFELLPQLKAVPEVLQCIESNYGKIPEKLGVASKSCLVFEDTEMGIQAATDAGMAYVRIPPPWEREV